MVHWGPADDVGLWGLRGVWGGGDERAGELVAGFWVGVGVVGNGGGGHGWLVMGPVDAGE